MAHSRKHHHLRRAPAAWALGVAAFAVLLLAPGTGQASCPGLSGKALEQCLKGELQAPSVRAMRFFDEQGQAYVLELEAVTRSIEAVCRTAGKDGLFVAYRNDGDRSRGRKWKELECKAGRLSGLWKEYFPGDDMDTVLYYDAAGTAVKQALFINGKLVREQTFSRPTR